MIDLVGTEVSSEEREMLLHPLVGGVILFTRNFRDVAQVSRLCKDIRQIKQSPILIAVDQEGGRVQRFQQGFTKLPPCRNLGDLYDQDQSKAKLLAQHTGWLMATELLAAGIDFSFAPVLDLDKGISEVIGNRAFHKENEQTAILATAYMQGMHQAGMAAVGKHFPGHGSVAADSHHEIPVDQRTMTQIQNDDLKTFQALIEKGIEAIMPAHVIFSEINNEPAGFSTFWLQDVLRKQLQFDGAIFSDDISMAGAEVAGDYPNRASKALSSGCDMVLVCNEPEQAQRVLDKLTIHQTQAPSRRLLKMIGQPVLTSDELIHHPEYQSARQQLEQLECTSGN